MKNTSFEVSKGRRLFDSLGSQFVPPSQETSCNSKFVWLVAAHVEVLHSIKELINV